MIPIPRFVLLLASLLGFGFLAAPRAEAQVNLTAGDVAVIGWQDNGAPADAFTIVALADWMPGTLIYFTNNGWTGAGFRNPAGSSDGNGAEQLTRLQVVNLIPAGTIISTTDVSPNFTWTTSGLIPGTSSGNYSELQLSGGGDQICVFQHSTINNPLNTAFQLFLYLLDDTGGFEHATDDNTGAQPPGISVSSHTALTFLHDGPSQNYMAFNTGALASGTQAQWLTAIANAANWNYGSTGALPSGSISVVTCPGLSSKPDNAQVCGGDTANFSVQATGSGLSFQWRRNGVNLANGGHYSGVLTPMLTVSQVNANDLGNYDVLVSNACGTITSTIGVLSFDTTDSDSDGTSDCSDLCPSDPLKISPGICGCGNPDTDSDGDGSPNCIDQCPNDPLKIAPGVCGCGSPDTDSDGDGALDCLDGCPNDPFKLAPGICGCGSPDVDSDGDGTLDCFDGCPDDPTKIAPGDCGCGIPETDTDGDGTPNCVDGCPNDPNKVAPGDCGCGVPDTDTDGDGTPNCLDLCPNDPFKIAPGDCGCGVPESACQTFSADISSMSLSTGGTQNFTLNAGLFHAGDLYFVVGSLSGTTPGIPFPGAGVLPLNFDAYTNYTVQNPNGPLLVNTFSTIGPLGLANAALVLPTGLPVSLVGMTVNHAYVLIQVSPFFAVTDVSNATSLSLLP